MLEVSGMSEEIRQEEIREEEQEEEEYIDKLIQKALEEGKVVTKFILELDEWVTLGSAISSWSTITILYGEIEKVLINTKYKYLMSIAKTYTIIPKSELVVLVYTSASDFGGQLEYDTTLYVFFKSTGWKSLRLS